MVPSHGRIVPVRRQRRAQTSIGLRGLGHCGPSRYTRHLRTESGRDEASELREQAAAGLEARLEQHVFTAIAAVLPWQHPL